MTITIHASEMIPGDIVRMLTDSSEPFQDMLVTRIEVGTGPHGLTKVHMVRPWMQAQPYPMTGHEVFTVWQDSSMTFQLMRKSEDRS